MTGPQIESLLQHAIDHSAPAPDTAGGINLTGVIVVAWAVAFLAGVVVQRYFS